jgi:hypothetical protein
MSERQSGTRLQAGCVAERLRGQVRKRTATQILRLGIVPACVLSAFCYYVVATANRTRDVWAPTSAGLVEPVDTGSRFGTVPRAAQSSPSKSLEVELLTITRQGMSPKELNLHKTRFILAVDNRSETRIVTLQLDRADGGGRVDGAIVPLEKLDWRTIVDVPAGHYVLGEASHPEWRCLITLNPN